MIHYKNKVWLTNLYILDPHVEKHSTGGNYLRSSVFGGMDGMMTTFSVVTAVIGVMCVFETIG